MVEQIKKLNGHKLELSHLDKVFFPKDGISKANLLDYYERIAEIMLPHLFDRPLTMQRFPDGIAGEGFYHKQVSDYFPSWAATVEIQLKEDKSNQQQILCNDAATLIYLANLGMITPHIWLSRAGQLEKPDKLIFDLDPPDGDFGLVRFAARELKSRLDELGLVVFVMTTGSKGLHLAVPLDAGQDFDEVRNFAHDLAMSIADEHPNNLTTEIRKDQRKGRLFIDYLRNAYGQTGVAPYAVRALDGAPVATPLEWDELGNKGLNAQTFTIKNVFKHMGHRDDPWREFFNKKGSLK